MKDKNLPDDIKAKSLDELREILNSLLTKIETSPNLENSADDYQKLIKVNNHIKHEKMFRKDFKYNYIMPINYNTKNTKIGKGSAIFIHLTKSYKPTAGCIALKKKDLLILLKLINRKTKIKIL